MSWFKNLLSKKTSTDGASTSNAAPPPLPPRRPSMQIRSTTNTTAATGSQSGNQTYVADPRALLVESLMGEYVKSQENVATPKLQQLIEIMMPPHFQHHHSGHHMHTHSHIPSATGTHTSKSSSTQHPAADVGPGLSEEAQKRNPNLTAFLSSAGARLADRVGALTGTVGAYQRNTSIASHTPMNATNAAMTDKQAARWLQLLNMFTPIPPHGQTDPYGARLLELLRLLSCKDEKRIGCLNASRLSTILLQCIHALAEMHPSTLEHMNILEKGETSVEQGGANHTNKQTRQKRPPRRHSSSSISDSERSATMSGLSHSHDEEESSAPASEEDAGSDFELEQATSEQEQSTTASFIAAASSSDAAATPVQAHSSAAAAGESHLSPKQPRTHAEYIKLPLVERIAHLQTLLSNFLGSLAHAIPTTLELVRSNSLIMLVRMCVGGNLSAHKANEPENIVQPMLGPPTGQPLSSSAAINIPLTARGNSMDASATAGLASSSPSASSTHRGSPSTTEKDPSDLEQESSQAHNIPYLLSHAQILALGLWIKLLKARPCLDLKVCIYLSKGQALKLLLSLLKSKKNHGNGSNSFHLYRPSVLIDLVHSIISILSDSSQSQRVGASGSGVSWNLFDEFETRDGYDLILRLMLWLRTIYQWVEAERIQSKVPMDTRFDGEDLCEIKDNPFLNPSTSLYPVLSPPGQQLCCKEFLELSTEQKGKEIKSCLARLLELLHDLFFISSHYLKVPSTEDLPSRTKLMLKGYTLRAANGGVDSTEGDEDGLLSPDDDTPTHPASQELRIKNLEAVKLILFVFVKVPIVSVRQEILNRMLLIYSAHPENLWLLYSLHPITYFIEMIPHLSERDGRTGTTTSSTAASNSTSAIINSPDKSNTTNNSSSGSMLQKLIWRLLEYIVNVSNVIPFQEITTIGLIMRVRSPKEVVIKSVLQSTKEEANQFSSSAAIFISSSSQNSNSIIPIPHQRRESLLAFEYNPTIKNLSALRILLQFQEGLFGYLDDSGVKLILTKIEEFIEENYIFREIFRETEILSILIQHIIQLSQYLDASTQLQKEKAQMSKGEIYIPNGKLEEICRLRPLLLTPAIEALSIRTIQYLLTGINNSMNLKIFREFGGSAALFSLLKYPAYREASLELISAQYDSVNFQEILEALQTNHGDPGLQVELLSMLCRMLAGARGVCGSNGISGGGSLGSFGVGSSNGVTATTESSFVLPPPSSGLSATLSASIQTAATSASARIKETYRSLGGFEAIFSLLTKMEGMFICTTANSAADSITHAKNEQQWFLLRGILSIINLSLCNHTRNRSYVWTYSQPPNHTWESLAFAIKLSGVLETGYGTRVLQEVMNLATETPQIPEKVSTKELVSPKNTKNEPLSSSVPTEQQPWCLAPIPIAGFNSTKQLESPATASSTARSVWPVIHSPDAILTLLKLLTHCPLEIQVAGLTSLLELVAPRPGITESGTIVHAPRLRNLEALCQAGVLEYFLKEFGRYIHLIDTSDDCNDLGEYHYVKQDWSLEASPETSGATICEPIPASTHLIQLCQQRSFLCQHIVETLATHRFTPVEARLIILQCQTQQLKWKKKQQEDEERKKKSDVSDEKTSPNSTSTSLSAASSKISPSMRLAQFFLRLLRQSSWSASGGSFLEFDLRGGSGGGRSSGGDSSNACLDIPSFGQGKHAWPTSGLCAFACWVNIRQLSNEAPSGNDAGGGGVATSSCAVTNRTCVSPLLQLFEFTSGDMHLWSACILPTGYLLVSAGHITSKHNTSASLFPWRQANLEALDEKGPGQGQALFEKYKFTMKEWTHVVLCHEKAKGQNRLLLSLYIDGQFVQQVQVQCAPASNSNVLSARGYIGVPPSATMASVNESTPRHAPSNSIIPPTASDAGGSNLVWWLNNIYFFSSLLASTEILALYKRGPGYTGTFASSNLVKAPTGVLARTPSSGASRSLGQNGMSGTGVAGSGAIGGVNTLNLPGAHHTPIPVRSGKAAKSTKTGSTTNSATSSRKSSTADEAMRKIDAHLFTWSMRVPMVESAAEEATGGFPGASILGGVIHTSSVSAGSQSPSTPHHSSTNSLSMNTLSSLSQAQVRSSNEPVDQTQSCSLDTEKVVFALQAHHCWSLGEHYASEASNNHISSSPVSLSSANTRLLDYSDETSLRTIVAYAESHDPGIVLPNTVFTPPSVAATSSQRGFGLGSSVNLVAYASGGCSCIHPLGFSSTLRRIGGVASLLAMLEAEDVRTGEDVSLLLTVLFGVIQSSVAHARDMVRLGGYTLLGTILQRKFVTSGARRNNKTNVQWTAQLVDLLAAAVEGSPDKIFQVAEQAGLMHVGISPVMGLLPPAFPGINFSSGNVLSQAFRVARAPIPCVEERKKWNYLWTYVPTAIEKDSSNDSQPIIIANALVLEHVLLNSSLWIDAPSKVQEHLLSRLASQLRLDDSATTRSEQMLLCFQQNHIKTLKKDLFDVVTEVRKLVSTLQKQSLLFTWVNDLLPGMDGSLVSGSSTDFIAQPNQLLTTRIPLPWRTSTQSLLVLADWLRAGYLPLQRFQLDMTEGPLRQRKKMVLQEEFYLKYKVHLPRLSKALPMLEAKHKGTPDSALTAAAAAMKGDGGGDDSVEHSVTAPTSSVDDEKTFEASNNLTTDASLLNDPSTSPAIDANGFPDLSGGPRARRHATLDFDSHLSGLTGKLSVDEDAKRLLEELPQLPLATLTQITAHAAAATHAHTSDDSNRHARRSRTASRRFSGSNLLEQHVAGQSGASEMAPISEGASSESASLVPSSVPASALGGSVLLSPTEPSTPASSTSEGGFDERDESGSDSGEDEDLATDSTEATPRRSFAPVSPTKESGPESASADQSSSSTSITDATAATANADDEEFSLIMRREALTRARSLATGGSRATAHSTAVALSAATIAAPDATANVMTTGVSKDGEPASSATAATPTPASSSAPEESTGPVSVELDEYEKILRLLEPGDDVIPGGLYPCSRVLGLDKVMAVAVLCTHHLYVVDHFTFKDQLLVNMAPPSTSASSTGGSGGGSGIDSTHEPLFHVEVTARPVSVPWTSEDGDSRQRAEAAALEVGDAGAADGTPPLQPSDVVLHVSKVTKSSPEDLSNVYKSKKSTAAEASGEMKAPVAAGAGAVGASSSSSQFHPMDDPDDPVTDEIGEDASPAVHKLAYSSLRELHKRRYSLMALGLEFFSHDGLTMLLVFETPDERDQAHSKIITAVQKEELASSSNGEGASQAHSSSTGAVAPQTSSFDPVGGAMSLGGPGLTLPSHARLRAWRKGVCDKWQRGEISNFAYLTFLNTFAGRSYNDFTQYPVFPWILRDYSSQQLHLDDERIYRDLSKPMGAIGEERAKLFQQRYAAWEDPTGTIPPFHYGTHFSSAASVLYFLIRLEPFTQSNFHLQGGKFDHADRLFFDLEHTWISASSQGGLSDVKELIPEFFYLPDFLKNSNKFNLGEHQRGGYVDDVKLPPWSCGDPRIFIRLHRRALESTYVSQHLHEWIDLIFGFKQRGKPAIKAQNVFYYLTYEDVVDVDAITDPMEKASVTAQIENFGQTPHQIFKHPHPPRNAIPNSQRVTISSHPQLIHPVQINHPVLPRKVGCLYWSGKQEKLFALDENKLVVPGSLSKYISWGHSDCSLRFHILQTSPRHRVLDEIVAVHEGMHEGGDGSSGGGGGGIRVVSVSDDGHGLYTGGVDGIVKVWRLHAELKHKQPILQRTLTAHLAPITAIAHARSYSLLITASEDGQVLFFDLNKLSLQRKLPIHPFPVTCIAIDAMRGDIITCSGPNIHVWDVNGDLVGEHIGNVAPSETIESVTWSTGAEGAWIEPNIITGHRDGSIRIWRLMYPTAALDAHPPPDLGSPTTGTGCGSMIGSPSLQAQKSRHESISTPAAGAIAPTAASASATTPTQTEAHVRLDSAPHSSTHEKCRPPGSLGVPFLTLEFIHRLEQVHESAVTALHTSPHDWKKLWSGDKRGKVQSWQISSQEHWLSDTEAKNCQACQVKFSVLERRHHCRECGGIMCSKCSSHRMPLEHLGFLQSVRVCDACFTKVSNANQLPSSPHATLGGGVNTIMRGTTSIFTSATPTSSNR